MIPNCVFLAHHNESQGTVNQLAQELQLRGLVPWVDKLPGGFSAGDGLEEEARRVIREEASAFLLYLTDKALKTQFIRDIEIPEALARRGRQPSFPIYAISAQYSFGEIAPLTEEHYGASLASYHGYSLNVRHLETEDEFILRVARGALEKHLDIQKLEDPQSIDVQVSSWESMKSTPEELLRVDATHLVDGKLDSPVTWARILTALVDIKRQLAVHYGRPRLVVNGSKHLTTAFIVGRVFNRFPLDIRQTASEYWRTYGALFPVPSFSFEHTPGSFAARTLIVEIATGDKDISKGVDDLIARGQVVKGGRLKVRPIQGRVNVTDVISRSLSQETYSAIDLAMRVQPTDQLHLFAAAPQAFFMTLGTLFQGMPDVYLYEWTGTKYLPTAVVPSAV